MHHTENPYRYLLSSSILMCSVIKWSDNGTAIVVARNMDWLEDMRSNLWLFPQGISREGLARKNSLTWISKYGSVITSAYDLASTDGMNEKSLACHMLWLAESEYGKRDENVPGLSISLWLQFFLDNFADVEEAVTYVENHPFQILPCIVGTTGKVSEVHMMIEDVSGDSAIFEYTDGGKSKVYHNKEYNVMTNSPPFNVQLENLKQYQEFGGNKKLPGTTEAADRFVRAAYYQKGLPKNIMTVREAVAGVISVARNVSQPFVTADPSRPNISPTRWRTVSDLTNRVYYFESTTSPSIIWVRLDELDFSVGAPTKKIALVNGKDRVGNVSFEFESTEPFEWAKPMITG
jgi:penicillin V acylase-like amidase (Ntn superfamily)